MQSISRMRSETFFVNTMMMSNGTANASLLYQDVMQPWKATANMATRIVMGVLVFDWLVEVAEGSSLNQYSASYCSPAPYF